MVYGAQATLLGAIVVVLVSGIIGIPLGLISGYYGGRTDNVIMRGLDMLLAFPALLLAILIVATFGRGLTTAAFALGIVYVPAIARLVRSVTLVQRQQAYVEAARAQGYPQRRIIFRHVLPNITSPIIVQSQRGPGLRDPGHRGALVPGPGRPAAGPRLGLDGVRGPHVDAALPLDGGRRRRGDHGRGGRVQPRGRRAAGAARPAPAGGRVTAGARTRGGGARPAPLLEVRDLVTSFRTGSGVVTAVRGIDLTIEAGEIVGLVGESGSGKSVTARSIIGLIPNPPGAGRAARSLLEGQELVGRSQRELQKIRGERIAMVFQDPMTSLDPLFTVGEQVAEAIRFHQGLSKSAANAHVVELFEKVGIPRAAERVARTRTSCRAACASA